MCHLILLLPVIALPIFWMIPLGPALLIYAVVLALSLWTYWYVLKSMRRPVETGAEELLHATGRVLEVRGSSAQVRVHSEIWSAVSRDRLKRGDDVEVDAVNGLRLQVHRLERTGEGASSSPAHPSDRVISRNTSFQAEK